MPGASPRKIWFTFELAAYEPRTRMDMIEYRPADSTNIDETDVY